MTPEARVLVTGGTGFIGGHLVRRLRGLGAEVHATSRRAVQERPAGVHWHVADPADAAEATKLVTTVRPDVVFHLAGMATGRRDPDLVQPIMHANLTSVVNLLAALTDSPQTRIVLAGSVEEAATAGESPYSVSKRAATAYALMYHRIWDLPVTVLRIAMTYGPDQPDEQKLVPYVIRTLLAGEQPRLSGGGRLVDWIYVDDVVDGFLAAARTLQARGQVIDIGSGRQVSIRETVELIRSLTRPDIQPRYGDLPDRPLDLDQSSDPAPAARLLGWQPSVDLCEGMRRTVESHVRRNATPRVPTPQ